MVGHALDHERRRGGACDREQDRRYAGPERHVGDAGDRPEIGGADDMAQRLHHRLGRVGRLAVEHALLEENIEKQSADTGEHLNDGREHAGDERNAAPFDVRTQRPRQDLHRERHQAEPEIDHRLVRNERDREHDCEADHGAEHVPIEDWPQHILPPLVGTPAIGEELDDREEDHSARDIHVIQQHAEQHHPARHAEHAGDEGGD